MFDEIYDYNSKENNRIFINEIFSVLLDIFLKIQLDKSGYNLQLKEVFFSSFYTHRRFETIR